MCRYSRAPTSVLQYFFVTFILLLQCFRNGAAIKCFVCDSSDNPSCADLKSNSSIVPEECTLDKMKSIDSWLFELNRFAYFDTGTSKSPLMNCQKVVARDPRTSKMVTARFCQLDTADSDACVILRSKMGLPAENTRNYNDNNNNGRRSNSRNGGTSGSNEEPEEEYHCSICTTDCCNGSQRLHDSGHSWKTLLQVGAIGWLVMVLMAAPQLQHSEW